MLTVYHHLFYIFNVLYFRLSLSMNYAFVHNDMNLADLLFIHCELGNFIIPFSRDEELNFAQLFQFYLHLHCIVFHTFQSFLHLFIYKSISQLVFFKTPAVVLYTLYNCLVNNVL